MTSEIRETIVEPLANGGFSVQLHISDKPKDAADASFRLILLATLPAPKRAPLHVQIQREAIRKAQEALRQQFDLLNEEVRSTSYSFDAF